MFKKKILILGYSSIVRRKVLPSLKKTKKFNFDICSVSSTRKYIGETNWYRNYNKALKLSDAEIVYISLPNSEHFKWAKKALMLGFHVVIDKPATVQLSETFELIKLAKAKRRLLAEALVYSYHVQITQALKYIGGLKSINEIHTNFIIPMPKKNNIRRIKKLKSYCIYDMGPYAASVVRIFCGKKIKKIYVSNKKDFYKNFNLFIEFNNILFKGHFSYGTEYQNNLSIFSKNKVVTLNKVFSPPSNVKINIEFNHHGFFKTIKSKKDDVFLNFFTLLIQSIKNKKFGNFYKIMERDSRLRQKFIEYNS